MHSSVAYDTEALAADLAVLRRITHVVDADGFTVEGIFWPREMTVLQLNNNLMVRYEFKLPCKQYQLSDKDAKSANYVRNNINGMLFSDEIWKKDKERQLAMLPASPDAPIACLREIANLSGITHCLFAYKGGNNERMWLEKANLCSINLEIFGCPRFDVLITMADKHNGYYQAKNNSGAIPHYRLTAAPAIYRDVPCDMHVRRHAARPPYRPIHCPAVECRVFAVWLMQRIAELAAWFDSNQPTGNA